MMNKKILVVLCCVLASGIADEKYTSKYDDMNVDEIINNERLYNSYYACLMDKGKCTREGKEFKDHLQEAFDTGCAKCTEAQEKFAVKIIHHMINNQKEHWEQVCAKYDHTGKWRKFYEDRVKNL